MTDPVDPVETLIDPSATGDLITPSPQPTVTSQALDVTEKSSSEDDIVHFNQAARALGVSRKTVERLVKRGTLERAAQGDANAALVTKRSLVEELERRRGRTVDASAIPTHEALPVPGEMPEAAPVPGAVSVSHATPVPQATPVQRTVGEELREVLGPLIEQVIDARTRAALLEVELRQLEEQASSSRQQEGAFTAQANDRLAAALSRVGAALEVQEERGRRQEELLSELVSGSWTARRRARQRVLTELTGAAAGSRRVATDRVREVVLPLHEPGPAPDGVATTVAYPCATAQIRSQSEIPGHPGLRTGSVSA